MFLVPETQVVGAYVCRKFDGWFRTRFVRVTASAELYPMSDEVVGEATHRSDEPSVNSRFFANVQNRQEFRLFVKR